MDESHLLLHEQTLHVFVGKLEIANAMLKRLVKPELREKDGVSEINLVPKKLKYAFKRESLDEAINALESWQRISDPSWFLVLKMADRQLDAELALDNGKTAAPIPSALAIRAGKQENNNATGITLSAAALSEMVISRIRFSDATIAQKANSTERSTYILDSITTPEANYYMMKKNIRDLARRLQHTEPQTFGLLSCKGFVTEKTGELDGMRAVFTMVFRTPQGLTEPRSLRDHLIATRSPGSLSHRFDIARQLANAISYVHTFGFVHKNVRPEAVLGFSNSETASPSVFLVGFDNFRKEEGRTQRLGDDTFEKNLYRHASRYGVSPESEYIMQHDIYSLGVCLLEVGLWQSFVEYDSQDENPRPSTLLDLPVNPSTEQIKQYLFTSAKEDFIKMARSQLPECMGTKYAEVVETCLTCLDPENSDFGDQTEFEDEDGIRIGVRYIEKVS